MAKEQKGLKKSVTFSMGTLLLFFLAFAAVGAIALWQSFASPAPPATLVAKPNPATVGSTEVFTGCGYYPNSGTTVVVYSPYAASWFGVISDSKGCIDSSQNEIYTNQKAGTYKVEAWQTQPNHPNKSKLMGATTYITQ